MIEHLLDRPIAYHPALAHLCGDVRAGIMLSQALYWSKRTSRKDGFFYKTIDEWEKETALGRYAQTKARKILDAFEFWTEDRRGLPAKLHFHVDVKLLEIALREHFEPVCRGSANKDAEGVQTSSQRVCEQECRGYANKSAEGVQANTESTTETTAETTNNERDARDEVDDHVADVLELDEYLDRNGREEQPMARRMDAMDFLATWRAMFNQGFPKSNPLWNNRRLFVIRYWTDSEIRQAMQLAQKRADRPWPYIVSVLEGMAKGNHGKKGGTGQRAVSGQQSNYHEDGYKLDSTNYQQAEKEDW